MSDDTTINWEQRAKQAEADYKAIFDMIQSPVFESNDNGPDYLACPWCDKRCEVIYNYGKWVGNTDLKHEPYCPCINPHPGVIPAE